MNADGSSPMNLTNSPLSSEGQPAWSPDGSKIAFASDRTGNNEIFVMNADGSNQINLANNGAANLFPSWSPDGTRIAFRSNRDGNSEVYVMNPDGSNQTNLTNNSANDSGPNWQRLPTGDADGDGIADNADDCPDSNLSATVVIGACNSGVTNALFSSGCTISDLIAECADGASNHGQFVSCVSHLTNALKKSGTITGQQKGAIQSCAAQADIP